MVRKQREELHLTYPLLNGLGLRKSYTVDATPKLMVLDAEGVVRGEYVGWCQETAACPRRPQALQAANQSDLQGPADKEIVRSLICRNRLVCSRIRENSVVRKPVFSRIRLRIRPLG